MGLNGPIPARVPAEVKDLVLKTVDDAVASGFCHRWATGIWQVSGRNDLPYSERVRLDEYYICSWSAWLDMHILCRTVVVVLMRRGAY